MNMKKLNVPLYQIMIMIILMLIVVSPIKHIIDINIDNYDRNFGCDVPYELCEPFYAKSSNYQFRKGDFVYIKTLTEEGVVVNPFDKRSGDFAIIPYEIFCESSELSLRYSSMLDVIIQTRVNMKLILYGTLTVSILALLGIMIIISDYLNEKIEIKIFCILIQLIMIIMAYAVLEQIGVFLMQKYFY